MIRRVIRFVGIPHTTLVVVTILLGIAVLVLHPHV